MKPLARGSRASILDFWNISAGASSSGFIGLSTRSATLSTFAERGAGRGFL
jgi:hypothetical protein